MIRDSTFDRLPELAVSDDYDINDINDIDVTFENSLCNDCGFTLPYRSASCPL